MAAKQRNAPGDDIAHAEKYTHTHTHATYDESYLYTCRGEKPICIQQQQCSQRLPAVHWVFRNLRGHTTHEKNWGNKNQSKTKMEKKETFDIIKKTTGKIVEKSESSFNAAVAYYF